MSKNVEHGCHFYGTSTIGERGQIVIPATAREQLNIKHGDQFSFFSHGTKIIHIVKADEMNRLLEKLTSGLAEAISDVNKKKEQDE